MGHWLLVNGLDKWTLPGSNAAGRKRVPYGDHRELPASPARSLYDAATAASRQEHNMLGWALTFLIVALIAAVLGFGGIAGFAVEIAKIIFFVAIILFVISAIFGLIRGRTPTVP
jgi:uncharacterized membrane protein YtjA (UPF0391 family)